MDRENRKFVEAMIEALDKPYEFFEHYQKFDVPSNIMSFFNIYKEIIQKTKRKTDEKTIDGKIGIVTEDIVAYDSNLFRTIYLSLIMYSISSKNKEASEDDANNMTIVSNNAQVLCHHGRIFHCSDHVRDMLMMTRADIHPRRLPFPVVFIDTILEIGDERYFGLILFETKRINERYFTADLSCESDNSGFSVCGIGYRASDKNIRMSYIHIDERFKKEVTPHPRQALRLGEFACNFIDFINDPSVKYVKASESSGASHRKLQRLYTFKKIDLTKTYFVKISNPLRRYVDQYVRMRTMYSYNHKFWVRGHFRTLHAERYGENIGKKIWITPFIKGQGVLIEKHYDVEKGKPIEV